MTTTDRSDDVQEASDSSAHFKPGAFSEEEIAAATAGPDSDPELDEVDAANIDEQTPDLESGFEKIQQKSRSLTPEQVRRAVESILFVSDKPLSTEQLYEATGIERTKIQDALSFLAEVFQEGRHGMVLFEVGGGWQFRTEPASADYVRRFLRVKPQRLTRAAVESLAIIAYRQPVTRPEIEEIRGVDSGAVLKALLDRRLIKILGKKDEIGRPILYGTTREFLEFFSLKNLNALPTLREFHELTEEHQEIIESEEAKPVEGLVAELADPHFSQKLEEKSKASEVALEELERALDEADKTAKTAAKVLNPQEPPVPASSDTALQAAPSSE